jgi:hypothetical protein
MKFEAVADLTRGVPVMGEREGRKLYDDVRQTAGARAGVSERPRGHLAVIAVRSRT